MIPLKHELFIHYILIIDYLVEINFYFAILGMLRFDERF